MGAAFVEYAIEAYFFPGLKSLWPIVRSQPAHSLSPLIPHKSILGLLLTFGGSGVRIAALFTAKHNFTHEIAEEKKPEHVLVTDGVYKFVRHPGYAGSHPIVPDSHPSLTIASLQVGSGGRWALR